MTKQIELKGKTCLLVEVIGNMPLRVINGNLQYGNRRHGTFDLKLPPGNWRILGSGKASEISESDWKEIVEEFYYPLSADIARSSMAMQPDIQTMVTK